MWTFLECGRKISKNQESPLWKPHLAMVGQAGRENQPRVSPLLGSSQLQYELGVRPVRATLFYLNGESFIAHKFVSTRYLYCFR